MVVAVAVVAVMVVVAVQGEESGVAHISCRMRVHGWLSHQQSCLYVCLGCTLLRCPGVVLSQFLQPLLQSA